MKQLIISEKVQRELLTDFMITGETSGLIGGYCEDEFPVYYANEEMAWMLGYDTVEELVKAIDGKVIRTEEGKKAEIPIIAMTANAFAEDRKRAFDAGMDGHIAKPIDIEKLRAVILSVLNKQDNKDEKNK